MAGPGDGTDLIDNQVPVFKMTDINGNIISSENTKGKIVVLNFWFTACKPCIEEIPKLNEVYDQYKDNNNVVFASVTFNEPGQVNKFLKKYPFQYPVVADARDICDLFGVTGYPTNIVIDKNGNYFYNFTGGFPQIGSQISRSIQRALDDKKP